MVSFSIYYNITEQNKNGGTDYEKDFYYCRYLV
jgi:hypothetical protein